VGHRPLVWTLGGLLAALVWDRQGHFTPAPAGLPEPHAAVCGHLTALVMKLSNARPLVTPLAIVAR